MGESGKSAGSAKFLVFERIYLHSTNGIVWLQQLDQACHFKFGKFITNCSECKKSSKNKVNAICNEV